MANEVRVAGVGMIPFTKPGASETYNVMGEKAALAAFGDAGLPYDAVQQVYVGYVYGDSTAGQAAVYRLGLSGVPIINTSTTTARPALRPSSSPARRSRAAWSTAPSRLASRR
ncbi:MAG: hypothetical protein WDM85_19480 [Caulobacteraceae bacterium]